MSESDTVKLLKECDAGTKTAVNSMKEVLEKVKRAELLTLLTDSIEAHEKLGTKANEMLSEDGESGKEPALMARAMSWMKTNFKLLENDSDATIAGLITDGCGMGIKQLSEYLNQYPTADSRAVAIAKDVIKEEERLAKALREYL